MKITKEYTISDYLKNNIDENINFDEYTRKTLIKKYGTKKMNFLRSSSRIAIILLPISFALAATVMFLLLIFCVSQMRAGIYTSPAIEAIEEIETYVLASLVLFLISLIFYGFATASIERSCKNIHRNVMSAITDLTAFAEYSVLLGIDSSLIKRQSKFLYFGELQSVNVLKSELDKSINRLTIDYEKNGMVETEILPIQEIIRKTNIDEPELIMTDKGFLYIEPY